MPSSMSSPQAPAPCPTASPANAVFAAPLGGGLVSLTAPARDGESAGDLLTRLERAVLARGLEVVQATMFCDPQLGADMRAASDFPITWLGRHDTPEGDVRGGRVTALPAGNFTRVRDETGQICGATWRTNDARYLLLGALIPPDLTAPRAAQAAALWRHLQASLGREGFAMSNLVRTWFFNDHILDWYDDFNRVRNAFFTEHNVFGTLVPASTGVGACNADGAALTVDALAVAPLDGRVDITAVASPLQCAAYDYKSAFSRAVECREAGGARHLLVSGTASIEPGGRTAHVGDLDAQIDLSLRVVAAILESRGMGWDDVARAILYFPHIAWMERWEARRAAMGLPEIPATFAHCDICRDDLLFEIELDAWKEAEK
ncbi:translation initiation inhibitor [Termitidicoccus mucosus]|uniref:Translation initiation inhibitor n=2 Tax=Termitidicoccus mucosus TaxID=1184151 RepID=A0A178IPH2_9BACT|nr:translation initiation inhibitor [Opitutaceae bacterium TSB47]